MSADFGEMDYTADEALYPGAPFPPDGRYAVELDAVDADTVEQMLRGIVTSLRSLEGITAVQVYRDGTYVDVYE